ncbi:glycoside hydrolase family 127 protein [Herbiconiux moechotypicola]|uniref:Glycoside hydrolase family 127 protein n=1 Tax=Herbiconiux moechotypicola TaxID=637393 RepID=A0ABN3DYJ6_9MICO|nr:glycoside hydrolase family 127 protein [Herbiconiux moechotypicola]MCS5730791.1 glycoside hydrolase family 127 protein [Herbiconiux moechotypicola]
MSGMSESGMNGMTGPAAAAPVLPSRGVLRPLGLGEVRITGGFWHERQRVNREATFAHIVRQLELDGTLPNFDAAAAGTVGSARRGRVFSDSDVYKLLEGLAWEIGRSGDAGLEAEFRRLVQRIARVQEADGYLCTAFGRAGQPARWSDLEWGHELYSLGHLFQAAVARVRTRPDADDGLVGIARRAADLVCEVFGPGAGGRDAICGHAEVELGLAELGRALGEPRYVDQARVFVERHGRGSLGEIEWGASYFQDELPLREATALRGHAVRANYLAAAGVDVAIERDDPELLTALRRQWDETVARRTYLTGGQGSHHQDEAFGEDWELPADRAYAETCAAIGSTMFSWRLLLATGEAKYADLMERTLFNVVAASPSRAGTSFFYSNTLHRRKAGEASADYSLGASDASRATWFEVSCCPPNIARTLASLATVLATVDDDGLQLHQYATAEVRTTLGDGRVVAVDVETAYPADGVVRVTVVEGADAPWTLSLRVPAWAQDARVTFARGQQVEEFAAEPGVFGLRRVFATGDVVELRLPMVPRWSEPDPRIDGVRGSVAVERGPLVLALESVDLGADVDAAVVDPGVPLVERDGRVFAAVSVLEPPPRVWPYGEATTAAPAPAAHPVALVPYFDWGERGPSTMRVWLPRILPPVLPAVTPHPAPAHPDTTDSTHTTRTEEQR